MTTDTAPLVTRGRGNKPYLRGTGLSPADVQSWADAGHSIWQIKRQYERVIGDWSEADIATVLTYPRIGQTLSTDAPVKVMVDDDGDIELDGWFRAGDAPAVIAAIEQARAAVEAWELECTIWDVRMRRG